MPHRTVAEKESQGLGPVPLRKIYAELRRSIQNKFLQVRINAGVSIQNSGCRSYTHISGGGNFTKSKFAFLGADVFLRLLF